MSEHDDTLLDEDLGDEEYDLCNDEEEALLADDYELERQNSYKGEEETDDVLDLGVTDALDDLEEDENIEYRSETDNHNQTDYYKEERSKTQTAYYKQSDQEVYKVEQEEEERGESRRYEENVARDNVTTQNILGKGDLREKLQKNTQKDFFVGNGQGLEDDDCEEAKERRNRFQNERTIISPKMNNEIPDSLENVVTLEQSSRSSFRGRDRGRGIRGNRGIRGGGGGCGRFNAPISSNFNPRFNCPRSSSTFDNQHPSYRPPLIDTRPPFPSGPLPNLPNQQILYPQNNPQMTQFQQFPPNGPAMRGPAPFVDNRLPFNPNAFQGPMGPPGPPGPRMIGPRVEFGPRGPMPGPPHPSYGCSPNQMPYPQNQQQHFQNQGLPIPDNHGRPPQGPPMQGNPGVPLHGNSGPPMPGNQGPPAIQRNPPSMSMQGFPLRPPGPSNQAPPSQNHLNVPGQPPFENRPPFQEPHFEAPRPPIYDSRPVYGDQPPGNQFNNGLPIPPQQTGPNVPNVPLPPGHKILINPHFRGAVQPTTDARLVWDAAQQQHPQPPPLQPQIPNDQLVQPPTPYQSQSPYNQSSGPRQNVQDYQPNYQQNKNDAYAYFSDVWQENKPQKTPSASSSKTYPIEASYSSRETSSYDGYENKYKSESQWEPREDYQQGQRGQHQNYRDRDPPPRSKVDHVPRSRVPTSSSTTFSYRSVSYEQGPAQRPATNRPLNAIGRGTNVRIPQKRISETLERGQGDSSPKRVKPNSRNLHEVKTVDTLTDTTSEHKEEENEDPETREYLRRMEAQKRLREQLLREKENRRKMAAMEKQGDEAKGDSGSMEFSQQETKPVSVVTGVAKDVAATAIKVRPIAAGRGRGRPLVGASTTEGTSGVRIVRTIQTVQTNATLDDVNVKDLSSAVQATSEANIRGSRQLAPALCTRRVVLHKPSPTAQKVATTIQKTVLNLQKGQTQQKAGGNQQPVVQKIVQNQFGIRKLQPSGTVQRSNLHPQRVPGGLQKTVINVQTVANTKVSAPNSQRVMLQKAPAQCKTLADIKTNTVKIENLAASTTEAQIRRMCNGIGMLESIHVGEGNATIVFKTQSAALVFHKKYQRKMLDLSLITVRLVPQTVGNKASTVAVRTS